MLHNANPFTRCNYVGNKLVHCPTQPYNVVKNLTSTNINLCGRGKRGKRGEKHKGKNRTSRPFSLFPSDPYLLV